MAGMAPRDPDAALLDDADEQPNVTDEEHEQFEDFVGAGFALLYENKQPRPGILDLLDEDPSDLMAVLGNVEELQEFSPTVAVAATSVMVVLEIMRYAEGDVIADEVIFQGGRQIVEDVAEIMARLGKVLTDDELNRAFLMAADLYRELGAEAGLVDEEALKGVFQEIVAADKEGRLGEILPQLERINQLAAEDMPEGEPTDEPAA